MNITVIFRPIPKKDIYTDVYHRIFNQVIFQVNFGRNYRKFEYFVTMLFFTEIRF